MSTFELKLCDEDDRDGIDIWYMGIDIAIVGFFTNINKFARAWTPKSYLDKTSERIGTWDTKTSDTDSYQLQKRVSAHPLVSELNAENVNAEDVNLKKN